MFGFSKAVFDSVISNLKGTSTSMEADSQSYTKQAQTLLDQAQTFLTQAQGFLTQAQGFLSHIPNFKWVDVTTTDSKGNETTTQERQPDPAQDASDRASAAECQQKAEDCKTNAEDCKTNAGVLQALASALLAQVAKLMESILGFTKAGEATHTAITNSTSLLVTGASMLGKVISAFNVPEAKNVGDWAKGFGNNLLKNFTGVDLSDGIDTDEVNKIAGIVVDTGATVVSGFTSIVVSSLVASTPIGGTVLASLAVGTVRGGTNFLLNLGRDTAAKAVSKNIVSGLNFLGIEVKEPEKKDGEHEEVELDGESAEAAAAAVSGNQSELGNGEEATAGTQKPSFDELALEIRQGKWGNGHQTRQQKLMEAGYITTPEEYEEIKKLVNAQIAENPPEDPPENPPENPPAKNANQWLRGKKAQIAELRQQKGELERNGASKKDIDAIDAKIDKLEQERDNYYESDRGVRTTNAQIAELRQQKGELERNGASKKDIDEIQSKINDAEKVRDGYSNKRNNVLNH